MIGREPKIILMALGLIVLAVGRSGAQIVNTHRGFSDDEEGWDGVVGLAIDLRTGNTEYLDLELDARGQYQSGRHRVRAIVVTDYRTAKGEKTAESLLAHVRYNYRFLPALSSIVYLQWGRDPFRRIEARDIFAVGARLDLFRKKGWPAAFGLSLAWESEEYTVDIGFIDPTGSEVVRTRLRLSLFLTVYSRKLENVAIDVWGIFEPLVGDISIARSSGSARVAVDILGGLGLVTTYTITHDSDPPSAVKDVDSRLRVGFTWSF